MSAARVRPSLPGHPKGRSAGGRLLLIGGAMALAGGMVARAQAPGLKHDWEAKHDIRAPHLKVGKNPKLALAAGELISLELKEGECA